MFDKKYFYYFESGERVLIAPRRIIFDDPILYLDKNGERIVPADEWEGTGMSIKNLIDITLEEQKQFMKIEYSGDDELIEELIRGAIDDVAVELNRGWTDEKEIPRSIRTAIKQTVLSRYENRGEMTIPESAQGIIKKYRFNPGT